jgi:mxaJ protein
MLLLILFAALGSSSGQAPLRICADPDNLPFSNHALQGFDNRIAVLVAHELHREPVFVWARSRRGFLRERFNKNACDMLLGTPVGMRAVAVTAPYYTSSYVFITPAREHLQIASFSDPQLNNRRIGLQILEENFSPPSVPLIRNGHAGQLIGFDSFGKQEDDVVRAVASGRIGVAVVWGPVAGYFAQHSSIPLTLTPVSTARDATGIPFTYSIGFGAHKEDTALLRQLNRAIVRLKPGIDHILAAYNVPISTLAEEVR